MASRKATKKRMKFRGAFYGPSGSGKTKSMLRLGLGIAMAENGGAMPEFGQRGRVGVIDSEEGDSELYAAEFDFNVIVLEDKTIDGYMRALDEAEAEGWSVAIIDSLSHAWRSLLEEVDAAKSKGGRGGSSFNAWADATPQQKRFVERLKAFKGHLLVSMRADTAWAQENEGGKNKPVRVGLKPEQGKGIEYEFTFLVALDTDHSARVEKDRTGKFQDMRLPMLTEAFGAELAAWLSDGRKPVTDEQKAHIKELCKLNGIGGKGFAERFGVPPDTYERADEIIATLVDLDPLKKQADATDKVLAAARPPMPSTPPAAEGDEQPSIGTDTSDGSPTEASPRPLPQPEGSASGPVDSSTVPTTSATSKTRSGGAPTDGANTLDSGITAQLVLVKRKVDMCQTAAAVGIAMAELSDVIEAMPKRPRLIARGYAAAVLKTLNGDTLTDADKDAKKALDDVAG